MTDDWQLRVDAVWEDDSLGDDERIAAVDELAAERAPDDPFATFERAGARDAAGRESEAEPLYRSALAAHLDDDTRVRATIQLASTLRNLGRPEEAITLLEPERGRAGGPAKDAVDAFYVLALVSAGDPVRAASVALSALAPHLSLYTRSVAAYARELAEDRG